MAIMIPETPHIFEPASQEGLMFDALTLLPDDYYVPTTTPRSKKILNSSQLVSGIKEQE